MFGSFHALRESAENFEQIAALVSKGFNPGRMANRELFTDGSYLAQEFYISWSRASSKLLGDSKGGFKYVGNDFLMYGETQFFWPPPLLDLYAKGLESETDASTASSLWTVKDLDWGKDVDTLAVKLRDYFGVNAKIGVFGLCRTRLVTSFNEITYLFINRLQGGGRDYRPRH